MTKEATLKVPAIQGSVCARTIRRNLEPMEGVASVEVDPESKTVDLKFDESDVTEKQIRGKLEEIGFVPDELTTQNQSELELLNSPQGARGCGCGGATCGHAQDSVDADSPASSSCDCG